MRTIGFTLTLTGILLLDGVASLEAQSNDEKRRAAISSEMIEIVSRLRSKVPQDLNKSGRYETSTNIEYTRPFLRINGCSFEYHWDQYSFAVIRFNLHSYILNASPHLDEGNEVYPPRAMYSFRQDPESLSAHWQGSELLQRAEREAEDRLKANGDPEWRRNARKEIAARALRGDFGEHIRANHYRSEDGGRVVWVSPIGDAGIFTRAEDKNRFLYLLAEYIIRFCRQ